MRNLICFSESHELNERAQLLTIIPDKSSTNKKKIQYLKTSEEFETGTNAPALDVVRILDIWKHATKILVFNTVAGFKDSHPFDVGFQNTYSLFNGLLTR